MGVLGRGMIWVYGVEDPSEVRDGLRISSVGYFELS